MKLEPGTKLNNGQYSIIQHIEHSCFCNTYAAHDTVNDCHVIIKEHWLFDIPPRGNVGNGIVLDPDSDDVYRKLFNKKLLYNLSIASKILHVNIFPIVDYFEENNTVYVVLMKKSREILDACSRFNPATNMVPKFIEHIISAINELHQHNLFYNIDPSTIFIYTDSQTPLLTEYWFDDEMIRTMELNCEDFDLLYPFNKSNNDIYNIGLLLYNIATKKIYCGGELTYDIIADLPLSIPNNILRVLHYIFGSDAPHRITHTGELAHYLYDTQTNSDINTKHPYVDLGLKSLWATHNIGANSPEQFGDYFSNWKIKMAVQIDNSVIVKSFNGKADNDDLSRTFDISNIKFGAGWITPSVDDFLELIDKCKIIWKNIRGNNGCVVIGPNYNRMFIPICGYATTDGRFTHANIEGAYWVTPSEDKSPSAITEIINGAFIINQDNLKYYFVDKDCQISIRPILHKRS